MQAQRKPLGVISENQINNSRRIQPKRIAKTEHKFLSELHKFENLTHDVFDCVDQRNGPNENAIKRKCSKTGQKGSSSARKSLTNQKEFDTAVTSQHYDSGIQSGTMSVSMETFSSTYEEENQTQNGSCCLHSTKIFSLSSDDVEKSLKNATDVCTQSIAEYLSDILKYLKLTEVKYRSNPKYITRQPEITSTMRTKLVDWLVEVQDEYKLENETLFLAVNYLDRFLSEMSVTRAKLQLLGTTVMFLAAKFEEIYPPDADEFAYVTADTYSKEEVVLMERLILRVLGCTMSVPTANQFLQLFLQKSSLVEIGKLLASYLCEISLMFDNFGAYLYSEIAAAAISLARCILKENNLLRPNNEQIPGAGDSGISKPIICDEIRDFMTSRHDKIYMCAIELLLRYNELTASPDKFVREKYSHKKFQKVSLLPPFRQSKVTVALDSELHSCDIARVEILKIWEK